MKRKSKLNNIRSRLNSGAYDMAKFKANEKNLRDKVVFFQAKEARGELKGYMIPRYDEAKAMHAKLVAMQPNAVAPIPSAAPAPAASPATAAPTIANIAETIAFPTLSSAPAKTRKRTAKKVNATRNKPASLSPMVFNPPPPNVPTRPIPRGNYNKNGQFQETGFVAPTYNLGSGKPFNNLPSVSKVNVKSRATRRQRTLSPIYNTFYEQAHLEFLPLPELYDPYTGRKFGPEENPLPPIESAFHELKDILKKAHKKAASLRKRAKKSASRKTKTVKATLAKPGNFNAGLRIRIPPNTTARKSKKRVLLPPSGETVGL